MGSLEHTRRFKLLEVLILGLPWFVTRVPNRLTDEGASLGRSRRTGPLQSCPPHPSPAGIGDSMETPLESLTGIDAWETEDARTVKDGGSTMKQARRWYGLSCVGLDCLGEPERPPLLVAQWRYRVRRPPQATCACPLLPG